MSTHDSKAFERMISVDGTCQVTGQQVEVRRDVSLWENTDGQWFVHIGEPDATDDPDGEYVSSAMIAVPDEAAGVFDDLFARIADPARLGVGRR